MEILSTKELKKVISSIDGYNDYGLDTFSEHLTDYCEELTVKDMDDILVYVENDLGIETDSELKTVSDETINDICDFINELFD